MNILFLCTGNSCRSQMAEGLGKKLKGDQYRFFSAGTKKHGLNARAVQVMAEAGVDISKHLSKTTDEISEKMDIVFTVCGDANENCPYRAGEKIVHIGFDDPPRLTAKLVDEKEVLAVYRRVRDEIKEFILQIEKYV